MRCPEVKDVALPDAPKPPPDHAREASPFARSGDVGKGAFPSNADKPKGKAIAPKDYFASAATGSGKGKGKTNAKEEKGESKKPAPAGGISSFFGKGMGIRRGFEESLKAFASRGFIVGKVEICEGRREKLLL